MSGIETKREHDVVNDALRMTHQAWQELCGKNRGAYDYIALSLALNEAAARILRAQKSKEEVYR